jgi:hypothetical protein
MPVWNVVRIVPVSLEAAWAAATALGGDADGLGVTTPIYTESDPPVRTATHKAGNGTLNASQLAQLQGAGEDVNGYIQVGNIDPAFIDGGGNPLVLVKLWDRSLGLGANPFNAMLSEHGLTKEAGGA